MSNSSIQPGILAGVLFAVFGMLAGVMVGVVYRRYFSSNHLQILIDKREERRTKGSFQSHSSDSSSHNLIAVQMSPFSEDFSNSIDYDDRRRQSGR